MSTQYLDLTQEQIDKIKDQPLTMDILESEYRITGAVAKFTVLTDGLNRKVINYRDSLGGEMAGEQKAIQIDSVLEQLKTEIEVNQIGKAFKTCEVFLDMPMQVFNFHHSINEAPEGSFEAQMMERVVTTFTAWYHIAKTGSYQAVMALPVCNLFTVLFDRTNKTKFGPTVMEGWAEKSDRNRKRQENLANSLLLSIWNRFHCTVGFTYLDITSPVSHLTTTFETLHEIEKKAKDANVTIPGLEDGITKLYELAFSLYGTLDPVGGQFVATKHTFPNTLDRFVIQSE